MLSRLISLLRRIPAVKWAFTRLRSSPHSGSIDVAPVAADEPPTIAADIAEASPALDTSIGTDPVHSDAAVAEDVTAHCVVAESPSATPIDVSGNVRACREAPTEVEPFVVEEGSVSPVDIGIGTTDVPELVISNDTCVELSTIVEPAVAEQAPTSSVDAAIVPVDAPAPIVSDEPALANDSAPVTAVVAEDPPADEPGVVTKIEPAPALVASSAEIRSVPKVRTRAAEPADRAALIRQRWAETGIRMWNPRLHGAGEATLNIQGSAGLLPPAPGETMPRYDKLEFRILGGQIICEGVIVEAPAQAGHRSFTRLAEPAKPDRVREPMRERQAALA